MGFFSSNRDMGIDLGTAKYIRGYLGEKGLININKDEIINLYREGIELGNLECYGQLAMYLYNNGLSKNNKYKEAFELLTGRKFA